MCHLPQRIYVRVVSYQATRLGDEDEEEGEEEPDDRYWAHTQHVPTRGWSLVADRVLPPSWDRACRIRLDAPVTLLPHTTRGVYIHSSLPDDLGLQYQVTDSQSVNHAVRLSVGLKTHNVFTLFIPLPPPAPPYIIFYFTCTHFSNYNMLL